MELSCTSNKKSDTVRCIGFFIRCLAFSMRCIGFFTRCAEFSTRCIGLSARCVVQKIRFGGKQLLSSCLSVHFHPWMGKIKWSARKHYCKNWDKFALFKHASRRKPEKLGW